ncbi:MAG: hypothetical protein AAGI53_08820 [Planctomycetota bacterium]
MLEPGWVQVTIASTPTPTSEIGRGLTLVLMLALLGIALVGTVAFAAAFRRARRLRAEAAKRRATEHSDAWNESARRLEVPPDGEEPLSDNSRPAPLN